ncbi:MAG: DUF4224 domain-containing protein, partial [Nitrosomonadaceae bacterium]
HVTGYSIKSKQISALQSMGVHFRVRPDGCPVVHESEFVVKDRFEQATPNLDWMKKTGSNG